ncbi:TPA: phosphoglucosamine mutase, partial [Candidatus Micrarchaeota archaeon]|nr:phosphoglucosamine mutase [Candidatus Micrarchaeota archaeon]
MLFGTSGIRGLYGEFVNEKLAMGIANLFAEKDVVIARDTRTTGESLAFAAISGVLARGRNAIYIDIAPTPTLALATKKYKCRGIMITASHNPPEYNGLKLFANGVEVSRKVEREVESEFNKGMRLSIAKWDVLGKLGQYDNAIAKHKKMIIGLVNSSIIKKKRPKVVIDPNGAGAVITASLLQEIGCETVSINDGLRGFERASEPNAENLKGLAAKVRELKADLGIGHDGDADRTVVVDEKGEVLPLDVQLAIMIEHELGKARARKKEATVVSTVEASLCVREAIE